MTESTNDQTKKLKTLIWDEKALVWDDAELDSIQNKKDQPIPLVSRAEFGSHIDKINNLIRAVIQTHLINLIYTDGTAHPNAETTRKFVQAALTWIFYDGRFKTEYSGYPEYFFVLDIDIDYDAKGPELQDKIKILWACQIDEPRDPSYKYGGRADDITIKELLEDQCFVAHIGVEQFVEAKLVERTSIGFAMCSYDANEPGVKDLDFFDLEEATALEVAAKPGELINWLQHGAYRALKMLIS